MNETMKECETNALLCAAEDGSLSRKLKKYLRSCRPPEDADPKKDPGRLPTLAGFCGMLGCGIASAEELRCTYPSQFDYVAAILEDEALNSGRSPAIVNAYLKERLGYGDKPENTGEALQLVFAHDILEDGE
ncbi:MAG: hypothetical protein IJW55_04415 [Clostridia bacterium]|nr:hypothetical protein [Clostridia bacterium]